jgi:hypothetical protein
LTVNELAPDVLQVGESCGICELWNVKVSRNEAADVVIGVKMATPGCMKSYQSWGALCTTESRHELPDQAASLQFGVEANGLSSGPVLLVKDLSPEDSPLRGGAAVVTQYIIRLPPWRTLGSNCGPINGSNSAPINGSNCGPSNSGPMHGSKCGKSYIKYIGLGGYSEARFKRLGVSSVTSSSTASSSAASSAAASSSTASSSAASSSAASSAAASSSSAAVPKSHNG